MKFYDFHSAPNPRRVRIFAAEKGIPLETVQIDLRNAGQFTDEFKSVNERCTVPTLELDDGTRLTESVAICRYLEEIQPEPALMGRTPVEKAVIEMWHRRVELEGMSAVADGLRNFVSAFKDRAVAGTVPFPQIPELAERGVKRAHLFLAMLNERLGESEFVAGDTFSIADIAAFVTVDFAGWIKVAPAEDATALKAWYDKVAARPSAKA